MTYQLDITPFARRQIKKLPQTAWESLRSKLDKICEDTRATGLDVKKLQGRDGYRLRDGNYRAIYQLKHKQMFLIVLEVGDRKEIY